MIHQADEDAEEEHNSNWGETGVHGNCGTWKSSSTDGLKCNFLSSVEMEGRAISLQL